MYRKMEGQRGKNKPACLLFAIELTLGVICGGFVILLFLILDDLAPATSLFTIAYPVILVGTLYHHWPAGLFAGTMTFLWGWDTLPSPTGPTFRSDLDAGVVTMHAAMALIMLGLAIAFRKKVDADLQARDDEIARSAMRLRELEHRTKNNFALVASLLQMQQRQENEPKVSQALDLARARIDSFARAYANLSGDQSSSGVVEMKTYLSEVVSHFADGGFPENVQVNAQTDSCFLPHEKAVGIGLFVNEALTNCAKHAFVGNRAGQVDVRFTALDTGGWELAVQDNGVGFTPAPHMRGTGSRLLHAFAQQAGASLSVESSNAGTLVRLTSADKASDIQKA